MAVLQASGAGRQHSLEQPDHLAGPFLLDPMSGPRNQVATPHPGTNMGLHSLDGARSLVYAPVALTGDKTCRLIDRPAGKKA